MKNQIYLLLLGCFGVLSTGFVHPSKTFRHTSSSITQLHQEKSNNPLAFLFNPYESKIPPEIRDEIYRAEANTAAAKDRNKRVATYAIVAFTGVLIAFFNVFISELRNGPTPDGMPFDLDQVSFGWVQSNFLFKFLFMNKIGGGICLLGGAGAGLLAEAELDTKRINAEKIYSELERRRALKEKKTVASEAPKRKKRRSSKETKRIQALSEVISDEREDISIDDQTVGKDASIKSGQQNTESTEDKGILGQLKSFYEKADNMAASQALLLNKELEDRGVVEKITDETGLKVIGKDQAAQLQKEKSSSQPKKD